MREMEITAELVVKLGGRVVGPAFGHDHQSLGIPMADHVTVTMHCTTVAGRPAIVARGSLTAGK